MQYISVEAHRLWSEAIGIIDDGDSWDADLLVPWKLQ